ncbi:glycosyltransferase [Sphingomonas sp. Leaf4]|uniref:glycosyltransferase n=1 Tax=Sphingomonas sp. Leaf4 TaxID=2876553 RepID=UPI001E349ACA|nr:hypothetical protein [Sphingomonas sp. Leaf4]
MDDSAQISITCDSAICVPLRDERRNIAGLIRAIARQDRTALARTVLLLCLDGDCPATRAAAATALADVPWLTARIVAISRLSSPDAGRARGAAMDAALALLAPDGVLLTTDADTRPDADWLAMSLVALRSADLVCGRIRRRDAARDAWRRPIETYLDQLAAARARIDPIAHDPDPHWNEGGASIALTAAAYRAVGGMPPLASGEDRALVDAVRRRGLRVRHDPAVRVATSSRATGRATGGLADAIRAGRAGADAGLVEHPAAVLARFARESAIRRAWTSRRPLPAYGIDEAALASAACAEALFHHAGGERGGPTPIALALDWLQDPRPAVAA